MAPKELSKRIFLIKKAIILFEHGQSPGDENLLALFIKAQIEHYLKGE